MPEFFSDVELLRMHGAGRRVSTDDVDRLRMAIDRIRSELAPPLRSKHRRPELAPEPEQRSDEQ